MKLFFQIFIQIDLIVAGVSNLGRPHTAQGGCECGPTHNHRLTWNLFFCSSVFVSVFACNVWPKTTLLPVWPRDTKRLDTFTLGWWKFFLSVVCLEVSNCSFKQKVRRQPIIPTRHYSSSYEYSNEPERVFAIVETLLYWQTSYSQ